jgi:hypothetical protein
LNYPLKPALHLHFVERNLKVAKADDSNYL